MSDLSRCIFLAGSIPFLLLGVAHALVTPLALRDRKGLSPPSAELAEAMARSHLRLTRRSNMRLAWVGFNLSHSLVAAAFGAFVLAAGSTPGSFAEPAGFCLPLAVAVSAAYVGLAVKYWFRTPIVGCAAPFGCFAASGVLRLAGLWAGFACRLRPTTGWMERMAKLEARRSSALLDTRGMSNVE